MIETIKELIKINRFNSVLLELAEYFSIENEKSTDIMFFISDLTMKHNSLTELYILRN